jgi:hypothetical protein
VPITISYTVSTSSPGDYSFNLQYQLDSQGWTDVWSFNLWPDTYNVSAPVVPGSFRDLLNNKLIDPSGSSTTISDTSIKINGRAIFSAPVSSGYIRSIIDNTTGAQLPNYSYAPFTSNPDIGLTYNGDVIINAGEIRFSSFIIGSIGTPVALSSPPTSYSKGFPFKLSNSAAFLVCDPA